ncbi:hypothetical protein V5O48_008827 [Marasmius crinis-equi]|uniref:Uncharacterized protein n=1 Tax=Marasmius crinis-equi TaxID=585013 RepID=A0ABR3FCT5_9AGAR
MSSGSDSSQRLPSSSSTHIVSETLKNAQHFSIGDNGNFSTVHGDQHNYYNKGTELKRRFIVGTEEEETEYAEFPEIKRGEFVAIRTICRSNGRHYDREWKCFARGERTVVAGDVKIGGVTSKCLVVQYSGKDAGETSRERATGGNQPVECPNARTHRRYVLDLRIRRLADGVADLVLLAHLADRMQMDCYLDDSLWMDTSRGVFCRGPKGPQCYIIRWFSFEDLPLDAELLKEDVMARYLGSTNQDRKVVDALSSDLDGGRSQMEVNRPTVISTLMDTTLALGRGVWKEDEGSCLGEREELANGAMRFSLLYDGRRLDLWSDWLETACDWLAQAPSIIHAYGIPLEGDMDKYPNVSSELVIPWKLSGTLSNSKAKQQRRKECPTIYLFIPPLSTCIFWSFDPNGQNPITSDLCDYLGLPITLSLECYMYYSTTETYKLLQTYQLARGFDPDTNEFARHNQYRIYEITKQPLPSRLEEIRDSVEPMATPLRTVHLVEEHDDMFLWVLFGDVKPEDPAADTVSQEANIWSRFIPTFSWAALDNSDIPAAGF